MDILSKKDRAYLTDHLLDGMPPSAIEAIKHTESLLCVVFHYQPTLGSERGFNLRKALVDLYNCKVATLVSLSPQAR